MFPGDSSIVRNVYLGLLGLQLTGHARPAGRLSWTVFTRRLALRFLSGLCGSIGALPQLSVSMADSLSQNVHSFTGHVYTQRMRHMGTSPTRMALLRSVVFSPLRPSREACLHSVTTERSSSVPRPSTFFSRLLVSCFLFCASCVLWLCFSLLVGFPVLAGLSSVALQFRTVLCWSRVFHDWHPCLCPAVTILLTFFAPGCGGARYVFHLLANKFRRYPRGRSRPSANFARRSIGTFTSAPVGQSHDPRPRHPVSPPASLSPVPVSRVSPAPPHPPPPLPPRPQPVPPRVEDPCRQ